MPLMLRLFSAGIIPFSYALFGTPCARRSPCANRRRDRAADAARKTKRRFVFKPCVARFVPPPRARSVAARKSVPESAHKKDMVSAVPSKGAVAVFSFLRKMRLQPTLRFYVRFAVYDLTRHRANLRALCPSACAARCHPLQRRGQDQFAFYR